ncbi:ferritin-like domain-containing protein [Xylariaceae sp. FL1651]|nr:ferritin-like domain-containing protein [Xylariaceae sp. FL1651]
MTVKSVFQASLLGGLAVSFSAAKPLCVIGNGTENASQKLADPAYGPIPGEDSVYNNYFGVDPPFPGYLRDAVLPTKRGPPGVDDQVWQNLLSAEWIIFDFYQKAVETFNATAFVAAGYPNTTYQRIQEIRNNEAGHLRIFQNMISPTSVKPGACEHAYPYYDVTSFLALVTVLEISSMAFLTGLVQQAKLPSSQGAFLAIAEVETRHEVWSLIEIWGENPFGGPADTVFPYANEILDTTNAFIVPGSCPKENPVYPSPRQGLPALSAAKDTASLLPGSTIELTFPDPANQPKFAAGKQYYGVFFHAVSNYSVPIDTADFPAKPITVTIPKNFETKGVIVAALADTPGAPTKETIVAGPAVILEQPAALGTALL